MDVPCRESHRGAGLEWGKDISQMFCVSNCVNFVIRSHECISEGYEVYNIILYSYFIKI